MTPQARGHLEEADKVFFVVGEPVTRMWLESVNTTAEALDDAYREGRPRGASYREMVERILEPVRRGLDVCVAFYGHPGVLVDASRAAIRAAREEGHEARMLPGISSLDCLFADLGLDPGTWGCQCFEATDFLLRRRRADPASALVLFQVGAIGVEDFRRDFSNWSRRGLEVLEQVLLETYPPEHEVILYEAALLPMLKPLILRVRLEALAEAEVSIGSTLYVPPRDRARVDAGMAVRIGMKPPSS